jgi:hypothetical protein
VLGDELPLLSYITSGTKGIGPIPKNGGRLFLLVVLFVKLSLLHFSSTSLLSRAVLYYRGPRIQREEFGKKTTRSSHGLSLKACQMDGPEIPTASTPQA